MKTAVTASHFPALAMTIPMWEPTTWTATSGNVQLSSLSPSAGTNLQNALQLAEVIGEDTARLKLVNAAHSPTNAVTQLLDEHGVQYTTLAGWDRIDAKELREGQQRQKVREKLATLTDLMHVAHPA